MRHLLWIHIYHICRVLHGMILCVSLNYLFHKIQSRPGHMCIFCPHPDLLVFSSLLKRNVTWLSRWLVLTSRLDILLFSVTLWLSLARLFPWQAAFLASFNWASRFIILFALSWLDSSTFFNSASLFATILLRVFIWLSRNSLSGWSQPVTLDFLCLPPTLGIFLRLSVIPRGL